VNCSHPSFISTSWSLKENGGFMSVPHIVGDKPMVQHATKSDSVSSSSQEAQNDAEFVSEDVYAETRGAFTRVTCHDVYAFSSIATSNDFSETVDSLTSMIQIGVEIEFPNGRREILVFQPRNLLSASVKSREQILSALFNEGEVWIGQFDSLFKPGITPKTWDTIVVPDTESADSVLSYRDNSLINYDPLTKEMLTVTTGGLSIIILGFMASVYTGMQMSGSLVWTLAPMGMAAILFYLFDDEIVSSIRGKFDISSSHLWMQRMDISDDELEECEPISDETLTNLRETLLGLRDKLTEATVLNVDESPKTTTLDVLTSEGVELSLEYPSPADNSERFTLNRVKDELGVGSVKMIEGEQVEISVTSLGKEDDVANDGFYRLRPKS